MNAWKTLSEARMGVGRNWEEAVRIVRHSPTTWGEASHIGPSISIFPTCSPHLRVRMAVSGGRWRFERRLCGLRMMQEELHGDHQRFAVTPRCNDTNRIIAGEVGSGKTRYAIKQIGAAGYANGHGQRVLVIAPKGVVSGGTSSHWANEIRAELGAPVIFPLSEMDPKSGYPQTLNVDFVLASFDEIVRSDFLENHSGRFSAFIIDEAHRVCRPGTKIHQKLKFIPGWATIYLLTATPFPNNISELHPMMEVIAPGALPAIDEFNTLFRPSEEWGDGRFSYCNGITCPTLLDAYVGSHIWVNTKAAIDSCFDYGTTDQVPCAMSLEQASAYNQAMSCPPADTPRKNTAWSYIGCLRAACDLPFANEKTTYVVGECVSRRMLSGLRLQTVIISSRRAHTELLFKALRAVGLTVGVIDGETDSPARERDKFNSGHYDVLIMGMKCADGHSFPYCNRLIVYSYEWSGSSIEQSLGRISRLSSVSPPHCTLLYHPGTVEETVFRCALEKRGSAASFLMSKSYDEHDITHGLIDLQSVDLSKLYPSSHYSHAIRS